MAPRRPLHPESLLRLHLVRHLLSDPCVRLRRRGVDARWRYARVLHSDYQGFNPMQGCVYYPHNSRLEAWLADPRSTARTYNHGDRLMHELMFAVHDYLHIWAYQWIKSLCPRLGFGEAPIRKANIEDFVFCHLLTEAVATVGLDYWFLATIDINDVCDIGTTFTQLTVAYRRAHEAEYRRAAPGFQVQEPAFYERIATFYCTGVFEGFDKHDLRQSARLHDWLSHELNYGVAQREYARRWYASMSRDEITYDRKQAGAAVSVRAPWKRALMRDLGQILWDKVKNDVLRSPPRRLRPDRVWRSKTGARYDFRFQNYNVIGRREAAYRTAEQDEESFRFLLRQMLAQLDFERTDKKLLRLTDALERERDVELAERVFRDEPRIRAAPGEPRDLFFLS